VSWAWWDWPLTSLTNHHPSVLWHCWLGHLTRKIVSEMTYNVSSGTLNTTIPYLLRDHFYMYIVSVLKIFSVLVSVRVLLILIISVSVWVSVTGISLLQASHDSCTSACCHSTAGKWVHSYRKKGMFYRVGKSIVQMLLQGHQMTVDNLHLPSYYFITQHWVTLCGMANMTTMGIGEIDLCLPSQRPTTTKIWSKRLENWH